MLSICYHIYFVSAAQQQQQQHTALVHSVRQMFEDDDKEDIYDQNPEEFLLTGRFLRQNSLSFYIIKYIRGISNKTQCVEQQKSISKYITSISHIAQSKIKVQLY